MAVDGIGSIGSTSGFGVNAVSTVAPANRREGRGSTTDVRTNDDPRAAFDEELQSLLGENGISGIGQVSRTSQTSPASASTSRTASDNADTGDTADIGLYGRPAPLTVPTYNASGRLNAAKSQSGQSQTDQSGDETSAKQDRPSTAPAVAATVTTGGSTLASQPTQVPAGAESGTPDGEGEKSSEDKAFGELSSAEEAQVRELQQRDAEVRAHEQAHQATGGQHAGGISYTYQRGPDNRQYAVGGSVPIDVSPVADDPEATLQKAEQVRAAAMAPASPSGQDQQVAAKAAQLAAKARTDQAEEQMNPEKDDSGALAGMGKAGSADKPGTAEASGKSGPSDDSDKTKPSVLSGKAEDFGTSEAAEKPGTAEAAEKSSKAAAAGLTGLSMPSVQTAALNRPDADTAEAAARNGLTPAGSGQTAATSTAADMPRPTESVEAMAAGRTTDASTSAAFSPAAQATRAAFSAMNSLDALRQSAEPAASSTASATADLTQQRAMSRATAAYARVRGETLPALGNTGISMAV